MITFEIIAVLGTTVKGEVLDVVKSSPAYSIIIDETCDVSVKKQMIVYFKHVNNFFEAVANFLGIISIKAGDAESIYTALTDYLFNDLLLEKSQFVAFGSDGAAVMVGHTNRVAAKLRQLFPALGNTHCLSVAQHLALALGGSSNNVMKVKFVLERLDTVHRHYKKKKHLLVFGTSKKP